MIHYVDTRESPSLLPIFRSQQQAELLALLLGDPDLEVSLTELAERCRIPYPSVHREVERAEAAGLVRSRKIGNTRLVRADTDSPYYDGLANVLVRAFGVPAVLGAAVRDVDGVTDAYIFGSWAARYAGVAGDRPVADLDLLVLGEPDRDSLYAAAGEASSRLGRQVQVTIRPDGWLEAGEGTFHDTIASRPMVRIGLRQPPSVLLGES
jgi:predicted nucleotidyltransferase